MYFSSKLSERYGPARVTSILVYGSLYVAIALTALLLTYGIINDTLLRARFWIACTVIVYLILVVYILRKNLVTTANWMLIILYEILAASVLINWGLSSSIGILTAGFSILLPGVLMAPRSILPVALITIFVIVFAHSLHASGIVTPVVYIPPSTSSILDVLAYATILAIFALVSWISARQSTLSLHRALAAEEEARRQKKNIAIELEKESSRLRQVQLEQMQQLYKFAVIGQSASATLHELSNHLSVLNIDIDDIKRRHRHSKAIANAEDGIEYINRIVREIRSHLDTTRNRAESFNAIPVINRSVKDAQSKFFALHIKLTKTSRKGLSSFSMLGDPLNLTQCINILLNNARDACINVPHSKVHVELAVSEDTLFVTISDNGPGIDHAIRNKIFQPLESTKPTGLGVGLYIAKHLVESQFGGKLNLLQSTNGATFQIAIKRSGLATAP